MPVPLKNADSPRIEASRPLRIFPCRGRTTAPTVGGPRECLFTRRSQLRCRAGTARIRSRYFELDSRYFTSQSRPRQFVIGSVGYSTARLGKAFCDRSTNCGRVKAVRQGGDEESVALCLNTQPCGFYPSDNTIYEDGKGLRILSATEREALHGFPIGWTEGFSFTRRVHMLGNTMTVPVVEWIGRTIMLLDQQQTE